MDNTTMTMNAVTCVLSVRPRIAGPVRLAAALLVDQGTTLSVAAHTGDRVVGFGAVFQGQVSDDGPHHRPDVQDHRCRSLPLREATGLTQTEPHLPGREPDITGSAAFLLSPDTCRSPKTDTAAPPPAHRPVPDRSGTRHDSSHAEQPDRDPHLRCGPSDQARNE